MDKDVVLSRTILLALTGSRAYNTHSPDSDSDYKGVCIGLKEHYTGFLSFEQKDKGWEDTKPPFDYLGRDTVVYEIRKFLTLALDNNPNILDMIFAPEYKVLTEDAKKILEIRDDLISKKCKFTFSGYAHSQLNKINMHRKWLLNPPKKEPQPEDFGITKELMLNKTEAHAFLEFLYQLIRDRIEYIEEKELLEKYIIDTIQGDIDIKHVLINSKIPEIVIPTVQELTKASDNYTYLLQQTHSYNTAKKHWNSYQLWKKNRNPERAKIEAKCGYDGKHAGHLIRLCRMGCEILEGKGIIVDRSIAGDAEEIKAIRNGQINFDYILEESDRLNNKMDELYKISPIPHKPRRDRLENLCSEIILRNI